MFLKRLISICALIQVLTGCIIDGEKELPNDCFLHNQNDIMFYLETDEAGAFTYLNAHSLSADTAIAYEKVFAPDTRLIGVHNGSLYLIERFGADNIVKINLTSCAISQNSISAGTVNIHDLVFKNDSIGYISFYQESIVIEYNLNRMQPSDTISVAGFEHAENVTSNASDMELDGNRLYVSLQRQAPDWSSKGAGTVLVVNTETNAIVDTLTSQYTNPLAIGIHNGALWMSSGNYGPYAHGFVESFDLITGTVTTLLDSSEIQGIPGDLFLKEGTQYYVSTYKAWGEQPVKLIDVSTRQIVSKVSDVEDCFGGLYYDQESDLLFVGERGTSKGFKIYQGGVLKYGPIGDDALKPAGVYYYKK